MQKKWVLWACVIPLSLGLILGGAWAYLFRYHEFSLEVRLAGEERITLEYGEAYEEPGAAAILRHSLLFPQGRELTDVQWTLTGAVDSEQLGEQKIDYTASFRSLQAQARRTVTVADTRAPVITLTQDPPGLTPGPYKEAGFAALDNADGDITDRVKRTEVPGLVTYTVTDSSGNEAQVQRKIPYFDNLPPEIRLEGSAHYTIVTGTPYREPGYSAADNADGDLTEAVQVSGEVCWYKSGAYPITYTVRDSAGNEISITRIVEVMAIPEPEIIEPPARTVYLTFDDGPGPYTEQLLDVLDAYGVKATFFVTGRGYDYLLKEIVDRGHSIGIHTMTHDYASIYESPEAFFGDLTRMQSLIYEKTGVRTTLMRFPGGSSNTVSRRACKGIMTTLTRAVRDAGFQYFDWNVDSNDAGGSKRADTVADNVIEGLENQGTAVVLQHDIHSYSVSAVEEIILWALENGYSFEPLTPNSPGFHHDVNN